MSEISSEAESSSIRRREYEHKTTESLNPSGEEKCLGCYPFARFPFFVLNNRNCKGVLQKDEHTCTFHRNLVESNLLADDFGKQMKIQAVTTERSLNTTTSLTTAEARYPKRKRTQMYGTVTRDAATVNNELETRSVKAPSHIEVFTQLLQESNAMGW